MINNQCQFEPSTNTSSATTCKWCGQEKWQHNKTIRNNKQTAVEWLVKQIENHIHHTIKIPSEYVEQAKEMEKQQQDTFAIEFAEWYENDVLAKGDYEMITKDKKELLEIFKETYEQQ